MTEQAVRVAMLVFWSVLMVICLWSLYEIYKSITELVRDMIEAYEEGKNEGEEEKEENGGSGTLTRGTELSGSNGGNAQKEEEGKCPQKKID